MGAHRDTTGELAQAVGATGLATPPELLLAGDHTMEAGMKTVSVLAASRIALSR
jgi:hypothetical protein